MTERNRPGIHCGRIDVVFVARANAQVVPIVSLNTPRGFLRVSTPEATAFDLVGYPRHCGGLDNVSTVLSELAEVLDPELLAEAAMISPPPWAQRLGYLLERLGATDRIGPLSEYVTRSATHTTSLVPAASTRGTQRDSRWRVAINAEVEADL